jgi:hypothetical protein
LALSGALILAPAAGVNAQILGRRRLRLIPREAHPWARFMPGAWRSVETETEIYRDGKLLEKTQSATVTAILNRDDANCCLEIATRSLVSTSDVTAPREVILPIDPEGDNEVKELKPEVITVDGKRRPVEVRQAKLTEKTGEKVMTVHLDSKSMPSVLRRETKIIDAKKGEPTAVTKTEVVSIDVPRLVAGENRQTWQVRTTHEHPAGRVETTEYLCAEVPGEMVYQESQEYDSAGKLLRRSTVELKEFGQDNAGRRRLFGRRESNRERRSL